MKTEIWIHLPTGTLAAVEGFFGEFMWNDKMEESYWGFFMGQEGHGWRFLDYL